MTEKVLPKVEMTDILQWPGTPGFKRWMTTSRHLRQTPEIQDRAADGTPEGPLLTAEESEDAEEAIRIGNIQEFEDWAVTQFADQSGEENLVAFSIIKEITLAGSNESMFGIAIIRDTQTQESDSVLLIISQLSRDTSWTGINRILPEIKGLDCFVIQDEHPTPEEPHKVLQVLAASPRFLDRGLFPDLKEQPEFPEGPPDDIRKILEWHGALSCTWMTIEPR